LITLSRQFLGDRLADAAVAHQSHSNLFESPFRMNREISD